MRLLSEVARAAFKLRAERVERGFALILDRGSMRRAWLRGREKVQKRYLIHVAGHNLGLILRLLTGAGTPRELRARASAWLGIAMTPDDGLITSCSWWQSAIKLPSSPSAFRQTRHAWSCSGVRGYRSERHHPG